MREKLVSKISCCDKVHEAAGKAETVAILQGSTTINNISRHRLTNLQN